MTWNTAKAWIQPLTPLVILLWVTLLQPGWSPAGLISRAFVKVFDAKTAATVDTAVYSAAYTYLVMAILFTLDRIFERWAIATFDAKLTTRWDKQSHVRISPGTPAAIDIEVTATFGSDRDLARLREYMPDLEVEVSWDNKWLAVTANVLHSATIRDEGDVTILSIPLLKGTGVSLRMRPSILVDVLHEETRKRAFTVKMVTQHNFRRAWLVNVLRKVRFSASSIVVRLDGD